MCVDILEFEVENKKNRLQKTILKMWFQICDKMANVSKKLLLEEVKKKI